MNILAFNTSTEKFSIAICKNNKIIYYYSRILKKNYSKFLIPLIQNSLAQSKINIKQIGAIGISLGPGSFTGIRMGISAARGLAIPHNIDIFGFSNMDLIIHSINSKIKKKKFLSLIRSKKKDYYYQLFDSKKKPINNISFFSGEDFLKFGNKENLAVVGDFDNDIKKKALTICKRFIFKKIDFSAKKIIGLFQSNHLKKKAKKLDPIYVYEHYAKDK